MQVVHAATEDAHAVATIHVEAWRAAYVSIVAADYLAALSVDAREAQWREYIAVGAPELLVAKEDGLVQGWLRWARSRDDGAGPSDAELWAVYVAPRAWATGVGRMLWQRARQLMLASGFTSCCVWVFPQNERAIRFYRAAGFVRDGCAPRQFELGGVPVQEVRYVTQFAK